MDSVKTYLETLNDHLYIVCDVDDFKKIFTIIYEFGLHCYISDISINYDISYKYPELTNDIATRICTLIQVFNMHLNEIVLDHHINFNEHNNEHNKIDETLHETYETYKKIKSGIHFLINDMNYWLLGNSIIKSPLKNYLIQFDETLFNDLINELFNQDNVSDDQYADVDNRHHVLQKHWWWFIKS